MTNEYVIKTPADFQLVIRDIFNNLPRVEGALVVLLDGDLGAGKTAFAKELAKSLGIEETVVSPTFAVMKKYPIPEGGKFKSLVHIDAYRIESESELGPLRLTEVFAESETMVCVEWPENIKSIIPDKSIQISITIAEGESRKVCVVGLAD